MKKPSNKKATMKDIAREAEVSVATVSYILNNVSNQSISEDTRCRVLEIAKNLNYVPNLSARSLVKGKSNLLGLILNRQFDDSYWKHIYYGILAERFEFICKQYGYHLIVTSVDAERPNVDIMLERELDGVFLVDVKSEMFNTISTHFNEGVPLVLVNSVINDPLFYKVTMEYNSIFTAVWDGIDANNRFLVMESFHNKERQQSIISAANISEQNVFIINSSNYYELNTFINNQTGKKGIVINEFLALTILNTLQVQVPIDFTVISTCHCPHILPQHVNCYYAEVEKMEATLATELMVYLLNNDERLKQKLFPSGEHQAFISNHNYLWRSDKKIKE